MLKITTDTIIKFIKNSKKIMNMEKSDKTLYHMRVGLSGINGPYIDFKHEEKLISQKNLEAIYNGDCIYKTNTDIDLIKLAIYDRENEIKLDQIEKKKKEFLKIVEEI